MLTGLPTARFLFGIGAGVCFTGYFALATDLIPKNGGLKALLSFGYRVTPIGP